MNRGLGIKYKNSKREKIDKVMKEKYSVLYDNIGY